MIIVMAKAEEKALRKALRKAETKPFFIYINMKNKKIKHEYVCSLIGISMYKLRQIKKINKKTIISQNQLL